MGKIQRGEKVTSGQRVLRVEDRTQLDTTQSKRRKRIATKLAAPSQRQLLIPCPFLLTNLILTLSPHQPVRKVHQHGIIQLPSDRRRRLNSLRFRKHHRHYHRSSVGSGLGEQSDDGISFVETPSSGIQAAMSLSSWEKRADLQDGNRALGCRLRLSRRLEVSIFLLCSRRGLLKEI